jgi:hypothetical protein
MFVYICETDGTIYQILIVSLIRNQKPNPVALILRNIRFVTLKWLI